MHRMVIELGRTLFPCILFTQLVNIWNINIIYAGLFTVICILALGFKNLKKGYLISWVILLTISFTSFSQLIFPISHIQNNPWIIPSFFLSVSGWLSIIVGKPFTIQYSRGMVPREKQNHPAFLRINYTVTSVWSGIFTISFMINFIILIGLYKPNMLIWLIYSMTLFGCIFSAIYPNYARKNLLTKYRGTDEKQHPCGN